MMEQEGWLQAQRLRKLKEMYNETLLKAYNDHCSVGSDLWSRPLTEGMIRYMYKYLGPLPEGSGCIIVGDFFIKPTIAKLYKIKPVALITKEEKENYKWTWRQIK